MVGTGSVVSIADRVFVAYMDAKAHMAVGTDYLGTSQVDTRLVPIQPKGTPHFSLSTYQLFFLSSAGMLYNLFPHVLPIYKIYRISLQGYLQIFANTHILHHGGLLTRIYDTMVALGHLMG